MKYFPSFKTPSKRKLYGLAVLSLGTLLVVGATILYHPSHINAAPAGRFFSRKSPPAPTPIPPPVTPTPPASDPTATVSFNLNHSAIITTFFWVGEKASSDNGYIANLASAWDEKWSLHYGGEDTPNLRNGYNPAGFTPKENPFYFALPYNDVDDNGNRKPSATNCPLASQKTVYSWCKNSWVAIRHNGKIAYAQWEDVGPFEEDDTAYVFGATAKPLNRQDAKAGLDVSPAVKTYLGLQDVDKADWAFVTSANVPTGPWKTIVTTTPGARVDY